MPYRPTERTVARIAATRRRIVGAARELVARGGYAEAQVAAVASRAGVATGTVYRHFPSKADLFAEVFREASQREVDAVAAAARESGDSAPARIAAAVETFARRALRGRRLAWALIAEPVDPAVEAERLVFRRAYRDVFARGDRGGRRVGRAPRPGPGAQRRSARRGDRRGAASAPSRRPRAAEGQDSVIASLRDFCIRSVTGKELASVEA